MPPTGCRTNVSTEMPPDVDDSPPSRRQAATKHHRPCDLARQVRPTPVVLLVGTTSLSEPQGGIVDCTTVIVVPTPAAVGVHSCVVWECPTLSCWAGLAGE
jgi:hypothetical protein